MSTDSRMYSLQLSERELRMLIAALRERAATWPLASTAYAEQMALANHLASELRG